MEFTTNSGKKITVTANRGNKSAPWQPAGQHYRVTVKIGNKSASFDFWDSLHSYRIGADIDLRDALECFASDAMAGMNATDATDIMDEFGYTDTKEARRVFKGVKHAQAQAEQLGLDWDELADLHQN